ncbi:MAG TPA: DUF308 domain-containing protein [Candidatus Saccharimonadales bacterium]|nr:DUF308 domain-containing protein [Candidatus Saccharimonadales bacterium]
MYTTAIAKDSWWALSVRGLVTVLLGVALVFWPFLTLLTVIYLFSAYIILSGLFGVVSGIMSVDKSTWWSLQVLLGVVELGFGVYLVRHLSVKFTTLLLLVGFVLVIRGLVEIIGTFIEGQVASTVRTLSSITGLAAIVAGVVILLQPKTVGVGFVWILGLYALIVGSLYVAMSVDGKRQMDGGKR